MRDGVRDGSPVGRDPAAFRAERAPAPPAQPSRRQGAALLAVLALVAGAVVLASYAVRPDKARAFDLFRGSVFLADQNSPVAVDLASGKPTLRLLGADRQVGSTGSQSLAVVPLTDHTLLLNQVSGEFNMVDNSGFVVKRNGGVPLVRRGGQTFSFGVAADAGQAYVLRTGSTGGSDVYLVNQPTVESAISATGGVRPRASTTMPGVADAAPGGAVGAGSDLWVLVGAIRGAQRHAVRELSVPTDSSAGAELARSDHGTVSGAAALGAADDGTVGLAEARGIRILASPTGTHTASFRAPAGLDRVLPSSSGAGRLAYLLHATAGWFVASVGTDGSALRVPRRIAGVAPDARLAAPAVSNDRLYTLDQADGRVYAIDYDGATASTGRAGYPLARQHGRIVEAADFTDAYVLARGSRVVFDSASHTNALMLFTDGSRGPLTIAKSSAVVVNAATGAEALAGAGQAPATGPGRGANPPPKTTRPQNVSPVNTRTDCKTVAQKPHVPVITSAVPGSRTVSLAWSYPVLNVQDCYPSTYLVGVRLLSGDAPRPPAAVRVQSQTGADIAGLFPSAQYEITVTAYLNGEGTASQPIRITTGKEGPAAPTDVSARADGTGNWTIDFDACGSPAQGCVPAQSWTITPSFCDGRGVSAPPAPISVTADPTSRQQPAVTYPGNDDLLGRGLQFQVQGSGDQGAAGAPSAQTDCVYSWTPPVIADLAVTASTPPQTAGSTDRTTTTARVTFAGGQAHDLGGVGGTLTYQLLHDGAVVTTFGPTDRPVATLDGVAPGAAYQVRVLASPPRHPDVRTVIGPVDVAPAFADWPVVQLDQPSFDAPPGLSGTLHVRFGFPAGTTTRGETFDLVDSTLACGGGNTTMDLDASDVAPGDPLSFPVDRATYNGACTVTIRLVQDPRTATAPPLFGAGTSAAATSDPVQLDPPSLTSTAADFNAQWGGTNGHPTVVVTYSGTDDLPAGARDWTMSVSDATGTCGTATDNPPPAAIEVDKSCIKQGGTFSVAVDYTYFLVTHAHFDVPVGGDAPNPVDPAELSFAASWTGTAAQPQIELAYTGPADQLPMMGALDWTEVVTSSVSPGVTCGTGNADPGASAPPIAVDLTACPATGTDGTPATYTTTVSFTDPNYGETGNYPITVTGTPPS